MCLLTSVCMFVCLSCSCSKFWKPWPRKFICGRQSKRSPVLDYKCWARNWSRFLGSQLTGDFVTNLVVGCHYFSPARSCFPRHRDQPTWLVPICTAWWLRHTDVSSLPKATTQWCPARTHDLWIASPMPYHLHHWVNLITFYDWYNLQFIT